MTSELNIQPHACLNTEEACADYLFHLKWPNGFSCPSCSFRHAYKIITRRLPLYECSRCGYQASLITGTVMEGSRTVLTKWFTAIKLISDPDHGLSARALSRIITVTYKTAWTMLHKIRYAMGKTVNADKLSGSVTINDSCYGKPYNPSVHLHHQEAPVLIGSTMSDGEPSRIAIRMVSPEHIFGNQITRFGTEAFIRQHVAADATVDDIQIKRYSPRKLKKNLPLFRLAHQWINETFHGLGKKHLQAYFNEFCCRTNMRLACTPIFEGISRICAMNRTITYSSLIRNKPSFNPLFRSPTFYLNPQFQITSKVI